MAAERPRFSLLYVFSPSVKGPELINMYVGQSEENVREGEAVGWPLGPLSPARFRFSGAPRMLVWHGQAWIFHIEPL